MIVDLRTRLHRQDAPDGGIEDRDDLSCIDVAVVVGVPPTGDADKETPEAIMRCVGDAPGARVGFIGVNPLLDDAIERVEHATELGALGVTISPADQGYRPTHDNSLQLLEHCAKCDLPVLIANPRIQSAESVLEYARPVLVDEVARHVPNVTLVMGDLGHGWIDETLSLIIKHERVFAEISGVVKRPWALYSALMSAYERGMLQRLLFGSGYPNEKPAVAIERIYTINQVRAGSSLPTIPREPLRAFVERDALKCIGVDFGAANGAPRNALEGAINGARQ